MARVINGIERNASWDLPTRPLAHPTGGIRLSAPGQPFWRLMLGILLLGIASTVVVFLIGGSELMREMPVSLHSNLRASYDTDPFTVALQPMSLDLVNEVLSDQAGENGVSPVVQLTTVMTDLQTPVPSITPRGTSVNQASATPTAPGLLATAIPEATGTVSIASTVAASETSLPGRATATQKSGPTATYQASPTQNPGTGPEPTATPVPGKATSTPTLGIKPPPGMTATATRAIPTATRAVPTATLPVLPTATLPVSPSRTYVPPTVTVPVFSTATRVPPSATPWPTATTQPTATSQPTATPRPTATQVPTRPPTSTVAPTSRPYPPPPAPTASPTPPPYP